MFFYAQIDEYGYCVGVSQLSSEILNSNMVQIDDLSINYLKRRYDLKNKKWTDEYLINEPEETLSKEEIINSQILNKLDYLECLAELNSMKGGNL